MPTPEQSDLVRFLFNQGTGVAFGITCLVILYFWHREHIKDKNETIEKLKSIIHDRKTDRDALLSLMGEVKAHLTNNNSIRRIAQEAVSETLHQNEGQRKRKLDAYITQELSPDVSHLPMD